MKLVSNEYLAHARSRGPHKYVRREGTSGHYKYIYAEDLRNKPNVSEVTPGDYRYTRGFSKGGTGKPASLGFISSFQVGTYERKHRAGQGAYRGTVGQMQQQKRTQRYRKGINALNRMRAGGLLNVLIGGLGD